MYLTQHLHKGLRETPHAEALVFGERRVTYAQLARRVERFASVLLALGVKPGDRVGMLALNSDRYVEFLYGCWWAGAVGNPVNTRWSAAEVAYSLDDCDTQVLFVDDAQLPVAQHLAGLSKSLRTCVYVGDKATPVGMLSYHTLMADAEARVLLKPLPDARRQGDDLALIMYTGGTTGKSKGVMLSQAAMYFAGPSTVAATHQNDSTVTLVLSPFFHIAGCGMLCMAMLRVGKAVLIPAFDELAVLQAIEREHITELLFVPTMLRRLLNHPAFGDHNTTSVGTVMYGTSPIDASLLNLALQKLPQAAFHQLYGMTELPPSIAALPAWCHTPEGQKKGKLRATGRPTPMCDVRIVDPDGKELPRGQAGEITVRTVLAMKGYWGKPEQTAQALRDGWMFTGDGGYMDEDGFIYVTDRIKDMIVSGGENVYSVEVESVVLEMPGVAGCAVVGIPSEQWGEAVHAVVVPRVPGDPTLTAEAVMRHCKERIAGYKCPRSVAFRSELPVSAAGKLLKYELRAPFWVGHERKI